MVALNRCTTETVQLYRNYTMWDGPISYLHVEGPHRGGSEGDVSQALIPSQRDCPNSYRLMQSPITRSCMRSVLEYHSVRRTSRLIRVRRLRCLLSIFCVCSLPT